MWDDNLEAKARSIIDSEYEALENFTEKDLWSYLAGLFPKMTKGLSDHIYETMFTRLEEEDRVEAETTCPLSDLTPDEEKNMKRTKKPVNDVPEKSFMIEELQDLFDISKTKATNILELAIKIPIMLKKCRSEKMSYLVFCTAYETEDDKVFDAWKKTMEIIEQDYIELMQEVASWENTKEMAKFNKSFSDLAKFVQKMS